jgi:hypothetical protein
MSSRLTLDFNDAIAANWAVKRQAERHASTSISDLDLQFPNGEFYEYLYWMNFGLDGNFLFFMDNEFAMPPNLAVFEL